MCGHDLKQDFSLMDHLLSTPNWLDAFHGVSGFPEPRYKVIELEVEGIEYQYQNYSRCCFNCCWSRDCTYISNIACNNPNSKFFGCVVDSIQKAECFEI